MAIQGGEQMQRSPQSPFPSTQIPSRRSPDPVRRSPGWILFVLMLAVLGVPAAVGQQPDDEQTRLAKLRPQIDRLIEQLGDEDFGRRQAAQDELKRFGVVAFDALREAQQHDDVEIARRARYLVRSIQVRWRRASDPPMILNALQEYGGLSESVRTRLLDRLAALPDAIGVPALARIARFETSDQLARRAALLIASRERPDNEEVRVRLADAIEAELGVSDRIATDWLRAYATSLRNSPRAVDAWEEIVAQAFDRRDRLPSQSNDDQVEDLLKIYIDVLIQADERQEAERHAERLLPFVRGRRDTMLNAIDWLLSRELYATIEELVKRYPQQAERFLSIRYRLAESQRRQGKLEEAEASAKAALTAKPEAYDVHVRAAVELQERSLLDWAIRELEAVIGRSELENLHHLHARLLLSEIHHDYEREQEAADIIKPIATRIEQEDKEMIDRLRQPPISRAAPGIVARMHLFYALHFRELGDHAREIDHLRRGSKADPEDADLLIAMHNAPQADEKFKTEASELIDDFLETANDQIRQLSGLEAQQANESTRSDYRNVIAMVNNQFAWLACNTDRRLQQALQCSHRSLELRPNTAAYLDTLAHCYAAVGDYANAVRYQKEAVRLEPYSHQIVKKLDVFRAQLAKVNQE